MNKTSLPAGTTVDLSITKCMLFSSISLAWCLLTLLLPSKKSLTSQMIF